MVLGAFGVVFVFAAFAGFGFAECDFETRVRTWACRGQRTATRGANMTTNTLGIGRLGQIGVEVEGVLRRDLVKRSTPREEYERIPKLSEVEVRLGSMSRALMPGGVAEECGVTVWLAVEVSWVLSAGSQDRRNLRRLCRFRRAMNMTRAD